MDTSGPCSVCGKVTQQRCSLCKSRFYCDKACQRKDWSGGHKQACTRQFAAKKTPAPAAAPVTSAPATSAPAVKLEGVFNSQGGVDGDKLENLIAAFKAGGIGGEFASAPFGSLPIDVQAGAKMGFSGPYELKPARAYQWVVDVYRMRVEDELVLTGETRGLYSGGERMDICEDFLIFCKAAVDVKHLPVEFRSSQSSSSSASASSSSTSGAAPTATWDWGEFLDVASKCLMFAVEKPDIVAEWGNAIPFRLWGEAIYGWSVTGFSCPPPRFEKVRDEVEKDFDVDAEMVRQEGFELKKPKGSLFGDVGGWAVWRKFLVDFVGPVDPSGD
ncbi:unnamed protein product [Vitrella brassicaformis CCMP3155]|uniref:MYND-type domain-containing protein n=1 Tax=Vitrella brassicaformis (strain CCMP3155) TaxID=1169540 RepID=A0A0G4F5M4_VITBC|nr:unnamed protein product [Vitrella brassicaformis CCMP3155]|mmetsp:Transcript_23497/g.67517  ORF Transcript_23497/g.67517 Transcript_23497/m.67517 type:complete len:330 (-) Transcript_23497:815-1804(-)|eukprot:CEM07660.1 unnamed protein product [Vitrella brassicaformis CCMP3155]